MRRSGTWSHTNGSEGILDAGHVIGIFSDHPHFPTTRMPPSTQLKSVHAPTSYNHIKCPVANRYQVSFSAGLWRFGSQSSLQTFGHGGNFGERGNCHCCGIGCICRSSNMNLVRRSRVRRSFGRFPTILDEMIRFLFFFAYLCIF